VTVPDSFRKQADACEAMGSPLTARVLRLLAKDMGQGAVAGRVLGWTGDPGSKGDALALRLAGGLHSLILSGADRALASAYADKEISDPALHASLLSALQTHAAHLLQWLESPPQTNEVRRSAVLIATGHWLAKAYGLPLVLSELGASAGLNLLWDRYVLVAGGNRYGPTDAPVTLQPDWQGGPPELCPPQVAERAGVDLNPLDPVRDRLRLMSYIWADQPDRLARTSAAATLAGDHPGLVTPGDAVDWLEGRLAVPRPGLLHLIYHTVAWQYFPSAVQAKGEALLSAAGAKATADAPLARLSMEADSAADGAAVTLTVWPGGTPRLIARTDFHGRWVRWLGL
jgi:hypothetical protein